MIRQIQLKGVSAIVLAAFPLFFTTLFLPLATLGQVIALLAVMTEMVSFFIVSSALHASDVGFIRSFAVQCGLRGLVFGAALLVSFWAHSATAVAMVGATLFVLSLVQLPFLTRLTYGLHKAT